MTWQYSIEWHLEGARRRTRNGHGFKAIVVVTSKPRSQDAKEVVSVEAWTSLDAAPGAPAARVPDRPVILSDYREGPPEEEEEDPSFPTSEQPEPTMETFSDNGTHIGLRPQLRTIEPLVIFVKVARGNSPIMRARVVVTATVEQFNGSTVVLPATELFDNGFGGEFGS